MPVGRYIYIHYVQSSDLRRRDADGILYDADTAHHQIDAGALHHFLVIRLI